MIKRLIIPILVLFCLQMQAQRADSVFAAYTQNKELPQEYLGDFSLAISYFPELKDVQIKVKEKNLKTVMAARPSFASFFKRKSRRTYILFIDTLFNGGRGLFYNLDLNARAGLIGHELSHISDYHVKNFFGLMGYGFVYLFNKRKIEHRTDEIAIEHGMFSYLYDYARIAFDPAKVGEKYYRYKTKKYYSPEQLMVLNNRKTR